MKAIIRQAAIRRSMPERRSAQAVSAIPAAPPEASSRVAARPGHRDLIALAPVDPALAADEHGSEQRDVAEKRACLEQRGQREPPAVAALDAIPRVLQADQARQREVQEGDRRDDEHARDHELAAGEV